MLALRASLSSLIFSKLSFGHNDSKLAMDLKFCSCGNTDGHGITFTAFVSETEFGKMAVPVSGTSAPVFFSVRLDQNKIWRHLLASQNSAWQIHALLASQIPKVWNSKNDRRNTDNSCISETRDPPCLPRKLLLCKMQNFTETTSLFDRWVRSKEINLQSDPPITLPNIHSLPIATQFRKTRLIRENDRGK